jgi:hypothetical protein
MLLIRSKHTFESVVRELIRGLEEGSVVLVPQNPPTAVRDNKQRDEVKAEGPEGWPPPPGD